MTLCIFCDAALTADTKPEHILLNALGGRKVTRRAICSAHNNHFGATIDNAITAQVAAFRNLLQLDSGTGKPPPSLRAESTKGERLVLRPDGTPELIQKPFLVTPHAAGGFDVQINARDEAELARIVPNIAAITGISVDRVWAQLTEGGNGAWTSRRPGSVHQQLSLGGENSLRSICKAALCLMSTTVGTELLRTEPFATVRDFVLAGNPTFNRERGTLDPRRLPNADLFEERFGSIFNLIYVRSNGEGRVVAHFTLYNLVAWQVVLAEAGGPPDLHLALASNPLEPSKWSDEIASEVDVSFEWLDVPNRADVLAATQVRMTKALALWQKRSHSQLAAQIVNRVFQRHGISDDNAPVRDPTLLQKITAEIADELAHHLVGLPHERPMTPEDLNGLRPDGSPSEE